MTLPSKNKIISYLKEEYDNRIAYFLKEIDVQDKKRDINVVKDAIGLKLYWDGFEYTLSGFTVNEEGIECAILRLPDEARSGLELSRGYQTLSEDDKNIELLKSTQGDSIDQDKKDAKYIYVPISTLETRFELK